MLRHCLALAVCVGVAGGLAGCGTPGGDGSLDSVQVRVSPGGAVSVNGKTVALVHLTDRLASLGATPRTRITVMIPRDESASAIESIAGRLASAGYRKVVFTRPRRADAFRGGARR
jgi:hypothetical protein